MGGQGNRTAYHGTGGLYRTHNLLGFLKGALVGLLGAIIGSIVSTRLMQRFTLKAYPELNVEEEPEGGDEQQISFKSKGNAFMRFLDAILDGGKDGVAIGLAIIPGVLIISTIVMMLTFGPAVGGEYSGVAYEGVPVLPYLAGKVDFIFDWLFGFQSPARDLWAMKTLPSSDP